MKHFLNLLDHWTFVTKLSPIHRFHRTHPWKHFYWNTGLHDLSSSDVLVFPKEKKMAFLQTDYGHFKKWRDRFEGRRLQIGTLGQLTFPKQVRENIHGGQSPALSPWSWVRNWVDVIWGHAMPCHFQWPLSPSLVMCFFSPFGDTTVFQRRGWPHCGLWKNTTETSYGVIWTHNPRVASVYWSLGFLTTDWDPWAQKSAAKSNFYTSNCFKNCPNKQIPIHFKPCETSLHIFRPLMT